MGEWTDGNSNLSLRFTRGSLWQMCSLKVPMNATPIVASQRHNCLRLDLNEMDVLRFSGHQQRISSAFGVDDDGLIRTKADDKYIAVKVPDKCNIFIGDGARFRRASWEEVYDLHHFKVVLVVKLMAWMLKGPQRKTGISLGCQTMMVLPGPDFDFGFDFGFAPVFDVDDHCCICLDVEPSVVCRPCGHKCCCHGCYQHVARIGTCPICRAELKLV